jgi:hypothetical protein
MRQKSWRQIDTRVVISGGFDKVWLAFHFSAIQWECYRTVPATNFRDWGTRFLNKSPDWAKDDNLLDWEILKPCSSLEDHHLFFFLIRIIIQSCQWCLHHHTRNCRASSVNSSLYSFMIYPPFIGWIVRDEGSSPSRAMAWGELAHLFCSFWSPGTVTIGNSGWW